ncbi:hypothetical protein BDQ17DRAFT_1423598 [Cyathus striatus]|nr:hypothetical protein BDQ17DRAFT_1423598 [Cyathus striatus]
MGPEAFSQAIIITEWSGLALRSLARTVTLSYLYLFTLGFMAFQGKLSMGQQGTKYRPMSSFAPIPMECQPPFLCCLGFTSPSSSPFGITMSISETSEEGEVPWVTGSGRPLVLARNSDWSSGTQGVAVSCILPALYPDSTSASNRRTPSSSSVLQVESKFFLSLSSHCIASCHLELDGGF